MSRSTVRVIRPRRPLVSDPLASTAELYRPALIKDASRWERVLLTACMVLGMVVLVAVIAAPLYHLFAGLLSILGPGGNGCSLGLCR